LSFSSYWDFGDGTIINYNHLINPSHEYSDTGNFEVKLYLENLAGCKDSLSNNVCVIAENKIYIPNSFTPNYDNCNDQFYIKGLGGFNDFSIRIFNRWGNCIFESNEVVMTNDIEDNNICNIINNLDVYYKMGSWDGVTKNGNIAPAGIYSYILKYNQLSSTKTIEKKGIVNLIR
jgi:gliding motility-associated-like protein